MFTVLLFAVLFAWWKTFSFAGYFCWLIVYHHLYLKPFQDYISVPLVVVFVSVDFAYVGFLLMT